MKRREYKAQQKEQVIKNEKIELINTIDLFTHIDKNENPLSRQDLEKYKTLCQNTVKAIDTVNKDIFKKLDLNYIKQLYEEIKGKDSFFRDNLFYEKYYENNKDIEAKKILYRLLNSRVETGKKYKTVLKIKSNIDEEVIKLVGNKIIIGNKKTKLTYDNVEEKVDEILEKLGTNSFTIEQDIKEDKFEEKIANILTQYEEQTQPSESNKSESVSSNPSEEQVVKHIAKLLSRLAKALNMSKKSRHLLGIILQKELKRHDLPSCMYYNYEDLSFFDKELIIKTIKLGMISEKESQNWQYIPYQDFHSIMGKQNTNSIGIAKKIGLNYTTTRQIMAGYAPEDLKNQPEKKQVEQKLVLKTIKVTGKEDDFFTANKRANNGDKIYIGFTPNQRGNITSAQFFKMRGNKMTHMSETSSDSESQNSYSSIS